MYDDFSRGSHSVIKRYKFKSCYSTRLVGAKKYVFFIIYINYLQHIKTLKNFLFESIIENAGTLRCPKTREELIDCIAEIVYYHKNDTIIDLNSIDTSKVTDMSYLFEDYTQYNFDVSEWDVRNVKDMSFMFAGCTKFNSDLSWWDVRNVKDMSNMFYSCTNFNSDLSKWNVRNVENMYNMFSACTNFNSDLSKWNVRNVKDFRDMFIESPIEYSPKLQPKF